MNVTDWLFYWAGPLACLSLPSVMSWIRSDTLIWKLAVSQSCSPRIKVGRKRVKFRMEVPILNVCLRPTLTVTAVWNTGETGDKNGG